MRIHTNFHSDWHGKQVESPQHQPCVAKSKQPNKVGTKPQTETIQQPNKVGTKPQTETPVYILSKYPKFYKTMLPESYLVFSLFLSVLHKLSIYIIANISRHDSMLFSNDSMLISVIFRQ